MLAPSAALSTTYLQVLHVLRKAELESGAGKMAERVKTLFTRLRTRAWGGTGTQDHQAQVMAQAEQAAHPLWGAIDAGNMDCVMEMLDDDDGRVLKPTEKHLVDQRDTVGANIVHRAYLHGKKDMARALLQRYPRLVNQVYDGEPAAAGATAVAVVG